MIEQFFMPLDRHFDSGFGATADSFHEAAKLLGASEQSHGFGLNQSRLPTFYLFRHCNELYFKSLLTILHRRFYGNFPEFNSRSFPVIDVLGKQRRIFQVHSIKVLYLQFLTMLDQCAVQIRSLKKTDWTRVPDELEHFVDIIDAADSASTMFRYPTTMDPLNDSRKSSYKQINPEDAIAEATFRSEHELRGALILAVQNDKDEITEAFIHDDGLMADVYESLTKLAGHLEGAHFGMCHEFLVNS